MSVLTLINQKGWVFEGVHNAYTVALLALERSSPSQPASIRGSGPSTELTDATRRPSSRSASPTPGPTLGGGLETGYAEPLVAIYPGPASSMAHYREVREAGPEMVPVLEFRSWSRSAAFPQVPNRAAFRVWRKMKQHPRFDGSDLDERDAPAGGGGDGDSGRSRETSTPRPTATGSSATTDMELPSSRGATRDPRQGPLHERRWRFRPVRELDATGDRDRFMNDDGAAAAKAGLSDE